jgi:7,8-dihydroneopterin aldolase/epimerase/oxygenase
MATFESSIHIDSLRLHARHGVLPQERVVGNDYVVTLKVNYDINRAMETDDVADTIDYSQLCSIVKEEMAQPSNLIEHVAGRIARHILRRFNSITALHLSITKVNPPMGVDCDGAGVEIHLTNNKN